MHQLLISDEARLDILEAFQWYENQKEGLGADFELCLEAGFYQIQRTPLIFENCYRQIRVCFIGRFPYGIHYSYNDSVIRFLPFSIRTEIQIIGKRD